MRDKKLTPATRLVLLEMRARADADGLCRVSARELGEAAGVVTMTAQRAIMTLKCRRLIEVASSGRKPITYRLTQQRNVAMMRP